MKIKKTFNHKKQNTKVMDLRLLSKHQQEVLIRFKANIVNNKHIFEELEKAVRKTKKKLEGNIWYKHHTLDEYSDKTKSHNIFALATEATNMLDVGFNAGHSCLIALLANEHLQITAVDIGKHRYVKPCFLILKKYFGDRIKLFIGKSAKVIPLLKKQEQKYDLIHIDACHAARAVNLDLMNCMQVATSYAYLVLNDTQKKHLSNLWSFYTQTNKFILPKCNIFPRIANSNTMHSIGVIDLIDVELMIKVLKSQQRKLNKKKR
jgi:hypothetical protein